MIILGGALLLAPGFITDVIGFALLIPPTRAVLRGLVARLARRRVAFTVFGPPPGPRAGPATGPGGARPGGAGPGGARPDARRGYDYEGSAHEVTDSPEIETGERRE